MALNKYYQGSFVSCNEHVIRCEIWRDEVAPSSVGELTFPFDSPLTIEWDADSKRDTIQGSTATLTVVSPADRTYVDMYTTVVGSVQLRVYRDNAIWWCGTLDTEHYEEPYAYEKDYDVTFTFTDFGILARLKYNMVGVQSINNIILNAIAQCALIQTTYTSYIATSANNENANMWTVRSDNFTDEDGEVMSAEEVLEAVLQPLDLHIRQCCGVIYVYDLHSLTSRTASPITWAGNDQVLSVDEVANSVRVTFSPYADKTIMSDDYAHYIGKVSMLDFDSASRQRFLTQGGGSSSDGLAITHAWYPDYADRSSGQSDQDYQNLSFGLYRTNNELMNGFEYINPHIYRAKFFPLFNGSETDCLIQGYSYSGHTHSTSEDKQFKGYWRPGTKNANITDVKLFTVARGNVAPDSSGHTAMKIVMEILYDARYNFETAAGEDNEKGNYNAFNSRVHTVYVPIRMYVRDANGLILCHYKNSARCFFDGYTTEHPYYSTVVDTSFNHDTYQNNPDGWIEGPPTGTTWENWECWLCYYSTDDNRSTTGALDGWTKNSHAIGVRSSGTFPDSYKARNTGEIVPLPPHAGQLVIETYLGVYCYDYSNNLSLLLGQISEQNINNYIRWHAYRAPSVTLVNRDLKFSDIDTEDIEYTGTLIDSAQDEISVDTICGTADNVPGAKGVYMSSTGAPITQASRNNRTDVVEQLLIGTLHSHYATRHVKLTGTILMGDNEGLTPMYDATLGAACKLLATTVVADLRADETEVTLIETSLDNYTSL